LKKNVDKKLMGTKVRSSIYYPSPPPYTIKRGRQKPGESDQGLEEIGREITGGKKKFEDGHHIITGGVRD